VWIGHASLLVQMHGVTFLTDPVLSERCSFSQVCATAMMHGDCRAGPTLWLGSGISPTIRSITYVTSSPAFFLKPQ